MTKVPAIDTYLSRIGARSSALSSCILSPFDLDKLDLSRKAHKQIKAMQRVCNRRYSARLPMNADIIASHFSQIVSLIRKGLAPLANLQSGVVFHSDIVEDED